MRILYPVIGVLSTLEKVAAHFIAIAGFVAGANASSAGGDWADEFPTARQVSRAAFEEMQVTARKHNFDNTGDDDSIAINLAGTYVVLRQIAQLKRSESTLSATQAAKLDRLVASYAQAELAIGQGRARRRGYITAQPPSGLACKDTDCYGRWFLMHLNASSGRAEYRERILKRLFPCGALATQLDDLRQRNATRVPYTPSPSATLSLPPAIAKLAPVACSVDGGDTNGNGLCNDWEADIQAARERGAPPDPSCGTLTLTKATTADAASIEVEYEVDEEFPAQDVRFLAYRSNQSSLKGTETPIGEETRAIPDGRAAVKGKLTILKNVKLPTDPNQPFVIVVARYGERDSREWFRKRLVGAVVHGYSFRYIHGLTRSAEGKFAAWLAAVDADSALAWLEDAAKEIPLDWVRDNSLVPREWLEQNRDIASLVVQDVQLNDDEVDAWQDVMVHKLRTNACFDEAIPFDWRYNSVTGTPTILSASGLELYQKVSAAARALAGQHKGDVVDVHLIGHSRGTVVISQALLAWLRAPEPALRGSWVHLTLLDPHPANNKFSPNEDIDESTDFGKLSGAQYRAFQDRVRDPEVRLPAGVGLREIVVWYQQELVSTIRANPSDEDGNGVGDFELRISPMNLWGLPGDSRHIVNQSGAPIRSVRLRLLPSDRGTMAHNGVPIAWSIALGRYKAPTDPTASVERGNCLDLRDR